MSILSFFERHRELKKVAKYSGRRKEKSSALASPTHSNSSALSVKIPDAGSGNWKGDAYTQSVSEYYAHTPRSRPQTLVAVERCAGPASAPPTTAPYNRRPASRSTCSAASSTASSFGRSTSASSGMSVAEGILIVLADEEEDTYSTNSTTTHNSPNPTFASSSPSLSLRPSSSTTAAAAAVAVAAPPPLPLYTPPPPPLFTPPASSSSSSRFEPRSCVSFDESARPHGLARASTMNAGKRNSVLFWKKNADRLDPSKVRSSEDYNSLDHVEYHQRTY